MICLKNRTFAVSQTTTQKIAQKTFWLWFAWKIVLLQYRKQPIIADEALQFRCDLLEKSYFCSIANNCVPLQHRNQPVVICLKNRTFAVSQTTIDKKLMAMYMLWFAWKIVLLQYRKQPKTAKRIGGISCDLLEKSYFCSIANNFWLLYPLLFVVVICLKNRTFAVSQTTFAINSNQKQELWFAWKIVLLQYRKQQRVDQSDIGPKLWFAWKIVLLQYRKQHQRENNKQNDSCDLLEKSYFCSIANNLNAISICITNRYKDLRNKKNETAKRNPTQMEWDFFFLIMPVC